LPQQARISLFHPPIPDDARDASALSQFLPVPPFDHPRLYVRFMLSYRDTEDLLFAERGLDVSYETVRRWVLKFGLVFARGTTAAFRRFWATGVMPSLAPSTRQPALRL